MRQRPSRTQVRKLTTVLRTLEGKGHVRARVRALPVDGWGWSPKVRRGEAAGREDRGALSRKGFGIYKDKAAMAVGQK